jgi:hypothetical protein
MKSTPTTDEIRDLSKKHDLGRAILIYTDKDDLSLGYVSYGKDKHTCDTTKKLADLVYDYIKMLFGREWFE